VNKSLKVLKIYKGVRYFNTLAGGIMIPVKSLERSEGKRGKQGKPGKKPCLNQVQTALT